MPPKYAVNRFTLRDAKSADGASPVTYVRSFLGTRFCVVLMDERQLTGEFACLDSEGKLFLREAVEDANGHMRKLGTAIVPLDFVQAMETREPQNR
jgi:small nuclear ribonucleoprotein (snRNP)-like protein